MKHHVTVIPELIEPIAAAGLHRSYRAYLLVRAIDEQGQGFVWWDDALAELQRVKSRRQAFAILRDAIDGGFGRKVFCRRARREKLIIRGTRAVMADFGVAASSVHVAVPVAELLGRAFRQVLYLAVAASRNGRPTARSTRERMSGLSKSSQIRAEKRAGVELERNYVEASTASCDAPNAFRRAADGLMIEEISCSTVVPEAIARPVRRRVSAPANSTGVYKSHGQRRRYYRDRNGTRRAGSVQWPAARPDIAGDRWLLVEADPTVVVRRENDQRVRYWRSLGL